MAYVPTYVDIDVAIAYNMITNGSYPDLAVLDVRTQSEYYSGYIYGALWIPATGLEVRIGELAGRENHEIIVYCGSGGRSVTASGILCSNNFTKVYNMLGGIQAWQSAGYPVWIANGTNIVTPFWMQWWFWAIVAVVIVALAGAVYFLKKKKPPTSTAPPIPTEGTARA